MGATGGRPVCVEVNHREGAAGNWSLVGKQPRAERLLSAIGQPLDRLVKDSVEVEHLLIIQWNQRMKGLVYDFGAGVHDGLDKLLVSYSPVPPCVIAGVHKHLHGLVDLKLQAGAVTQIH